MARFVDKLFGRPRRSDPLDAPFPAAWQATLEREVRFHGRLPSDGDREQLRRDIFRFVEQKTWTPFDIEIDDRKKVIVAAHACLLLNGRVDLPLYPRTREIILRADLFGPDEYAVDPDGRLFEIDDSRIGEAWYRGPIVLSWEAIEPLRRARRSAENVIVHEFAHALDHLDGVADGTPPLESRRAAREWAAVFTREFERLRDPLDNRPQRIDPYGAVDPAEFFAVVSEQFFSRPVALKESHGELYEQLRRFFRQDPAAWGNRSS